jgi:hypothetical protein
MNGQPLESPLRSSFGASIAVFAVLTAAALRFVAAPILGGVPILGLVVAALAWILPLGTVAVVLAWLLLNRTVPMLGFVLATMPMHFLAVTVGQIFGLPHMVTISTAADEIPLLLLTFILWRRNGLRLKAPDWFLFAFFTIAAIRTAFGGGIRGFIIDDFGFLIPYAAGRVTVLTDVQERLWAKCAVWIAAVLSVAGMVEVFILGAGPRLALYAVAYPEAGGDLPEFFRAGGLEGMRAASIMRTPTIFAAVCMVALVIWWVYPRNPVPAVIIFAGLVCAVTRSAWIGTAVAVSVLAFRLGQKRRLASYALLGIMVFAAAIPILGLRDYLFLTATGQDDSQQVHRATLVTGLEYVGNHPLGTGAESVGPQIVLRDAAALHFESSYLILAAQYGLLAGLCFVGFVLAAMHRTWKHRTPLGYVASAILIAFGIMMFFLPMHEDYPLDCWVWFPVGLAVRSAIGQGSPTASGLREISRGESA